MRGRSAILLNTATKKDWEVSRCVFPGKQGVWSLELGVWSTESMAGKYAC